MDKPAASVFPIVLGDDAGVSNTLRIFTERPMPLSLTDSGANGWNEKFRRCRECGVPIAPG